MSSVPERGSELLEALIRLEGRMDAMMDRLDRQETTLHKCMDDHEDRIRALESWMYRIIGKFAIISVAIAAGVGVLTSWVATFWGR